MNRALLERQAEIRHQARERRHAASNMVAAPRWTPDRDAKIIEAGGKYSKIAVLAKSWGMSSATVTARWHILRAR